MKNRFLAFLVSVFAAGAAFAAASTGNCMKKAVSISVGTQRAVTLVNEWDPDLGEYYDMGVYYYKMNLTRGNEYTVWIEGGDSADLMLDVFTDWNDESAPLASFTIDSVLSGTVQVGWLRAEDWMEDDPYTGTFYIAVSGDIGQRATLHVVRGIVNFTQIGEESNPKPITVTTTKVNDPNNLIDGEFYFKAVLEKDRKYRFSTLNGSDVMPLAMSIYSDELVEDPDIEVDPTKVGDKNNAYYYVYPKTTAEYVICVYTTTTNPDVWSGAFKLGYMTYAARKSREHPYAPLNEGNGYSQIVVPGRLVDNKTYYDHIIDESLCQLYARQGERWAFETVGGTKSMMMRAYKSGTTQLAENLTMGYGRDVRTVVEYTEDANYYVGVCQYPVLGPDDKKPEDTVTLRAYRVDQLIGPDYLDLWDRDPTMVGDKGDDVAEGATLLTAYPGSAASDITAAGSFDGPHVLSVNDWEDWYKLPCRAGLTYVLKTSFVDGRATRPELSLKATVYHMSNGSLVPIDSDGSLTPTEIDTTGSKGLTFKPDANGMYYIRVSVAEGAGLDFPHHFMHAMVYGEGDRNRELGLAEVVTQGADCTWRLAEDLNGYFDNGSTVAMELTKTDGSVNVFKCKPTAVSGYHSADLRTNVVAWTGLETDITRVVLRYDDDADPMDNELAGNTWLDPTFKEQKAKRTLWEGDPRDHFAFKGKVGRYYNFWLEDKTEVGGAGDAVFSIAPRNGAVLAERLTELRRFTPDAEGKFDLVVTHDGTPVYSKYFLRYNCVDVGTVQFTQSTYTLSEDNEYVELTLTRTTDEGALRVHWATQVKADSDPEYQAHPGEEYYPDGGVIAWADGDKEPKTIRVRLIPDKTLEWDCSKKFNVAIWPMEADALKDDEYVPVLAMTSATVKLTESSEKKPGTVIVDNQPLRAVAGDALTVRVARRDGDDGRIAVKMKTLTNADVLDGVDIRYLETNLVWEANDDRTKEIVVQTLDGGALTDKSFNLKFTVLNTGDYAGCDTPVIAAVKVPVTIRSKRVEKTVEELGADLAKAGVDLSYTGDWFVNGGLLRSDAIAAGGNAKMRFVMTGPGYLLVQPQIAGGTAKAIYQIGSQPAVDCSSGDELVLSIPSGSQSVMFKIKDSDGSADLEFADMNGLPCKWLDFGTIVPTNPRNGAVVGDLPNALMWKAPAGVSGGEQLWYKVHLATTAQELEKNVIGIIPQETTCPLPGGSYMSGHSYFWRVDYGYGVSEPTKWIAGPATWKFSTGSCDAPRTVIAGECEDAHGNLIGNASNDIYLVKGVLASIPLGAEGDVPVTGLELVAGELPPGLALKQNIRKIKGTPTSLGDFSALVRVINGTTGGTTMAFDFHVQSLESAAGNFIGVLHEEGDGLETGLPKIGLLTLSTTTKGVATALVRLNGRDLAFSAKNLDAVTGYDADAKQQFKVTSTLTATESVDGIACERTLTFTLGSAVKDELMSQGELPGTAKLTVVDKDGFETVYTCELYRKNSEVKGYDKLLEEFSGYYTVSLVPEDVRVGWPTGHGYLTVDVGTDGSALVSGRLADGTTVSLSSYAQLIGDLEEPRTCALRIPIGTANALVPAPYSFGGVLEIRYVESTAEDGTQFAVPCVNSSVQLEWNKDSKYATYDNLGFRLPLYPTGGWYNSEFNLQRYYLNRDFSIEAGSLAGLPEDMLPPGYSYTVDTTPHGVGAYLIGNEIYVPTEDRVREKDNESRYDFAASVNPWKTKVYFERETGLVTGTFQAWSDDGVTQINMGLLNHYGVMLFNRDANSPLDLDVWTSGFYTLPMNSKRILSFPFCIRAEKVDRDWSEAIIPAN